MIRLVPVLFLLAALGGCDRGDQNLSIATGGTGGVYFPLGGGFAEIINRHLSGYRAVAEVTGGSIENLRLVYTGESDIGFTLADSLYHAYSGSGPFRDRPLTNLRILGALYSNALHLVTLERSDVRSLSDLIGRSVSVGAPGSGTELSARALLEANGITYDRFRVHRLNFNETANALRDNHIEAGFWSVAPPTSAILDLAATRSIRIVQLSAEELTALRERAPSHGVFRMPPETYPGQGEEVTTVKTPNLMVVSTSMPEELAEQLVRLFFENRDQLASIHPAARSATVEFTLESSQIPLHAGVIRYLENEGVEVPESLIAER